MSKVIDKYTCNLVNLDCEHSIANLNFSLGDEVECAVCVEVKAARVEALRELKPKLERLIKGKYTRARNPHKGEVIQHFRPSQEKMSSAVRVLIDKRILAEKDKTNAD